MAITQGALAPTLTIGRHTIHSLDGLFSLNDLHAASGNAPKHRPGYFLDNTQTKALIAEIETAGIPAVKSREGRNGGTFACRELVIAYAAWISPAFHLKVIRVFLEASAPLPKRAPVAKSRIPPTIYRGMVNSLTVEMTVAIVGESRTLTVPVPPEMLPFRLGDLLTLQHRPEADIRYGGDGDVLRILSREAL